MVAISLFTETSSNVVSQPQVRKFIFLFVIPIQAHCGFF